MSALRDPRALLLLALGLLQMAGDLLGVPAAKGLGAVSMASPAPRVFSAVRGLETYSTRFYLEWRTTGGEFASLELTPTVAARLRGPYNRRNVYGAALAYGPLLASDPRTKPMLASVLRRALGGELPLLQELGVDPASVAGDVHVRYEAVPGSDLGTLPAALSVGRDGPGIEVRRAGSPGEDAR